MSPASAPMEAAQPDARRLTGLVPSLLDFEKLPGRYRLALREPGILFEQAHAVLQLAAGRTVQGMPPLKPGAETESVQRAARYFVRTAMLRPGADHYTLLGLTPGFAPQALRDHYRLMIRMTHPDFASANDAWPADAASRINLANDVLGNVVRRSNYNAALQAEKATAAAMPAEPSVEPLQRKPPMARPAAPIVRHELVRRAYTRPDQPGGWSPRSKMALAGTGAVACMVALWLLTPSGEGGSLVSHRDKTAATVAAPPISAALESPNTGDPHRGTPQGQANQVNAANTPPPNRRLDVAAEGPQSLALAAPAPIPAAAPQAQPLDPLPLPARKAAMATAQPATQPIATAAQQRAGLSRQPAAKNPESPQPEPAEADQRIALKSSSIYNPLANAAPVTEAAAPTTAWPARTAMPIENASVADASLPLPSAGPPVAPAPLPALVMADVQPKLAQITEALDAGRYDIAMRVVDPAWNTREARIAFLKNYYEFLQGQKVVQLVNSTFRSQTFDTSLVVHGALTIKLVNVLEDPFTRDLQIKATFARKNGKPVLTRLEASAPKP